MSCFTQNLSQTKYGEAEYKHYYQHVAIYIRKYMSIINSAKAKVKDELRGLHNAVAKAALPFLPDKSGQVYDCFLFNNELEILRLRLQELDSCVHKFVICECASTFTGAEKPLYYQVNKDLFSRFEHKIIHYVIETPPLEAYVVNPANANKKTSQFWQRNQMANALREAKNNDFVMVSDVDEIPKTRAVSKAKKYCHYINSVVFFKQDWYLLFLNIRVVRSAKSVFAFNQKKDRKSNDKWLGTFASSAKTLRSSYNSNLNMIWSYKWGSHKLRHPIISNAGWHFSYMGGIKGLSSKVKSNGLRKYSMLDLDDIKSGFFIGSKLTIEQINDSHPLQLQLHPDSWSNLITKCTSFSELASVAEQSLSIK